jgi:hypothetical protein
MCRAQTPIGAWASRWLRKVRAPRAAYPDKVGALAPHALLRFAKQSEACGVGRISATAGRRTRQRGWRESHRDESFDAPPSLGVAKRSRGGLLRTGLRTEACPERVGRESGTRVEGVKRGNLYAEHGQRSRVPRRGIRVSPSDTVCVGRRDWEGRPQDLGGNIKARWITMRLGLGQIPQGIWPSPRRQNSAYRRPVG